MSPITHIPTPLLGPGEWLGQYLRLFAQALDERPVGSADSPTDWRYDWTEPRERRPEHRKTGFE